MEELSRPGAVSQELSPPPRAVAPAQCRPELSRPTSPPAHLVLTPARLLALGPPRHVRAPRRFLVVRAPLSESSLPSAEGVGPPDAFAAFLGTVSEAEKTKSLLSPSPVRWDALAFTAFLGNVSPEVEKALLSPSPARRPATEASQAAFLGKAEKTPSLLSPSPARRPAGTTRSPPAMEASQAVLSSFYTSKKSLVPAATKWLAKPSPASLFKPKATSSHKPSSRKSWKE